ncbi:hypothetical protein F52700_11393 [Fusarium sp. NRRL 52700]|nr:hypothetical protein F52700_11393 [Fusarium sp. NRRL 52700]
MSQGSTTVPHAMSAKFITSPYANNFVKVLLKGNSVTWIHKRVIPGHVLSSKSTQEPASKSAEWIMDMQDIGNDTAHVIIHYFYTKQYHCIKPSGVSGDTAQSYELGVSLQVIKAARKMLLPALVDLANGECARICHEMDLLNLVAVLGKMDIDFKNFPELTQHVAFHLEKVLAHPHSPFASNILSRATPNDITEMLIRKLVMIARDEPTSEPKVKPRTKNEARGIPIHPWRHPHASPNFASSLPEFLQGTGMLENPQPYDKGKRRGVSKPAEHASNVPETKITHDEFRGAKGQEEARSGPSRVRDCPCPSSPPCGGSADAKKKANPSTPELESFILKTKDFVVVEKSSAADCEGPNSEAEHSQKPESSTLVDSDDDGVLVVLETQPTVTPSPAGSARTSLMSLLREDPW